MFHGFFLLHIYVTNYVTNYGIDNESSIFII